MPLLSHGKKLWDSYIMTHYPATLKIKTQITFKPTQRYSSKILLKEIQQVIFVKQMVESSLMHFVNGYIWRVQGNR